MIVKRIQIQTTKRKISTTSNKKFAEADVCEGHFASFRNRLTATQVSTVAKLSFTYLGGRCSNNV